jgi:hypothetical protein
MLAAWLRAGFSLPKVRMAYPLHRAAGTGDLESVARILAEGTIPVDTPNRLANTALYTAAVNGHEEVTAYLLSKGANPNAANSEGTTPLMGAAKFNQVDALTYLLGHGANLTAVDGKGKHAADYALASDSEEALGALAAAGLKPAPRSTDPEIYLLAGGHGCEDIGYDTRETMPEGYKLIAFNQCGSITLGNKIFNRLVGLLTKKATPELETLAKDNFLNIEETFDDLKTFLGVPMSLYLPGDKYPNLYYYALADHDGYINPSGVRKYPINADVVFERPGVLKRFPMTGSSAEFDAIYKDSVYPTVDVARRMFDRHGGDYKAIEAALRISVKDLMARQGPGLYIFMGCRTPSCEFPIAGATEAAYKLEYKKYEPYIVNIPGRYNELLGMLGLKNSPEEREVVKRVMLTRQLSQEQQEKRATKKARRGRSARRNATRRKS